MTDTSHLPAPASFDEQRRYAELAAKVQALAGEIAASAVELPALSLSDAWSVYSPLLARRVKPATAYKSFCYFRAFCRWVRSRHPEVIEVRGVTRRLALDFFDYNCSRSSAYSAGCYASCLSCMWRALMARDETAVAGDPYPPSRLSGDVWNTPPVRTRTCVFARRALTLDELTRVYAAATGELRLLFAVGLYTGLRLGDCALLDWSQIDLVGGFLTATPRKTETTSGLRLREALPQPLIDLLAAMPSERRAGPVLPGIAADYAHHRMRVIRRVQAVFRKCGIEMTVKTSLGTRRRTLVGFHSLRHSYVSLVLNRGGNLSVVQKTVGHASSEMTEHYLHVDEKSLKATAALLPDIRVKSEEVRVKSEGEVGEASEAGEKLKRLCHAIDGLGEAEIAALEAHLERRRLALSAAARG